MGAPIGLNVIPERVTYGTGMVIRRVINVVLAALGVSVILMLLHLLALEPVLIVFHDLAHSVSLFLALSLTGIAVVSYIRDGRERYLFLSAAFITLTIHEGLTFLSTSFIPVTEPIIPLISDPISHWLNLLMITLLFTGLIVKSGR